MIIPRHKVDERDAYNEGIDVMYSLVQDTPKEILEE